MRYLITGGAGFIGSHLAEHLLNDGHTVHVIDNLSTGSLGNIQHLNENDRFSYTIGNILDYHTVERNVEECDQIFHMAAAVGVKLIMEKPVETIITNVQGTENVLKLAHYHQKKILVASTSEVYGKSMDNNGALASLNEKDDWTLGPTTKRRWAYACSKAIDEFLALAYFDEKQLPVIIARFFNTVGPRQSGRYGMVIPNFVQRALGGEAIKVFGDGDQSRCFTHVYDAIRAITTLMETPDAVGQVFNIGGMEEISMNELASRVCKYTGSEAGIDHVPYEEVYGAGFEDMRRRTPDISKLREVIGYEPKYSIDDILHGVIDYYKNRDGSEIAFSNNGGMLKV